MYPVLIYTEETDIQNFTTLKHSLINFTIG